MTSDNLNRWLTLAANLGVVVGLIFLIVELDQANRIGRYAAENSRRSQFIEINNSRIEYSDLYAKLQANESDLTPSEKVQALMMSRQLLNTWYDAEAAYRYGLLSEETFEITLVDMSVVLDEAPGLIPHMKYLDDAYGLGSDSSLVSRRLGDLLRGAEN